MRALRATGRLVDVRRWRRSRRIAGLVIVTLVVVAAATVSVLAINDIHDRDERSAAVRAATSVGESSVPQVLSYSPASVDKDLGRAATLLTGDFRDKFASLSSQVIAPAAKDQGITTAAKVVQTSTVSASANHVTLLMFVNQTTSTRADDTPKLAGSRIRVVLQESAGSWLISDLAPL